MKKIIIGLTPQGDAQKGYNTSTDYVTSLLALGALPIVLPSTLDDDRLNEALSICDGILFTGGPDVRPSIFGEEIIPSCGAINDERDAYELKLYSLSIAADKSILGICRGLQVMNIADGGNIYQDIYSQSGTRLVHHTLDGLRASHTVTISNEDIFKTVAFSSSSFITNSFHHQSLKDLAPSYSAFAYSSDGLIEGAYRPDKRFVVGVQWHPEKNFDASSDCSRVLIDFVESCKG